jgi:hypothetical protein
MNGNLTFHHSLRYKIMRKERKIMASRIHINSSGQVHFPGISSPYGALSWIYPKVLWFVFLAALVLVTACVPRQATAIGFSTVDRDVRISLDDTLINGTLHNLLLTIDTTGYTDSVSTFLHAISLRPLSNSLTSADVLFRDPPGTNGSWSMKKGKADQYTTYWKGNDVTNDSGWFSEVFNGLAGLGTGIKGGIFLFRWQVDYKTSTPVIPLDFKVVYVDGGGRFVDQTSGTLSPTSGTPSPTSETPPQAMLPEPSTIVGLGMFAVVIALFHLWHKRQSTFPRKENEAVEPLSQSLV